jgi:hypothetical protein
MLSQKELTVGPVVIAPGAIEQVSCKAPSDALVTGAIVGPGAQPVTLFVGRERFDVPPRGERFDGLDEGEAKPWVVEFPVKKDGLILLTVKNVSDEPKAFSVAFQLKVEASAIEKAPAAAAPLMRPARNAALTQALPAEPKTTPADHGVEAGDNEVALVMFRNEVQVLLAYLRDNNQPGLPDYVKFGIIRRFDSTLNPPKSLKKR